MGKPKSKRRSDDSTRDGQSRRGHEQKFKKRATDHGIKTGSPKYPNEQQGLQHKRPGHKHQPGKMSGGVGNTSRKQKAGKHGSEKKGKGKKEESDESSNDSSSGDEYDEVQVDFEHSSPAEGDFHGMKMFFNKWLDDDPFDESGLADLIVKEGSEVGTVVKVVDQEEVYGLISALSFKSHGLEPCMQQITKFIQKKCPSAQSAQLENVLGGRGKGHTGLLVNERMVNVPPELALPLAQSLFDELRDPSNANACKFDNLVLLTKVLREEGGTSGSDIYLKVEEEVYAGLSTLEFTFRLNREADDGLEWFGKVIVISTKKVKQMISGVRDLVGDLAIRNQI